MRRRSHLLLAVALIAPACGGGDLTIPADGVATGVVLVDGNGQTGSPGATLAAPLIVRVVDSAGNGVAGRVVSWVVAGGGGSTSPQRSASDESGLARARWQLGPAPGANTLAAVVDGAGAVAFSATAAGPAGGGGPSASQSALSADPTSILAGTGVATITVTVRDDAGAPIQGATVILDATGQGNSLTQPTSATGADGVAAGTLRSDVPGTKVVSATVDGTVLLDATAEVAVTAAPPDSPVDHFVFRIPPGNVNRNERFTVEVVMVDAGGTVVPLSGIAITLGLFKEGKPDPSNKELDGNRAVQTQDGVATFPDLAVKKEGAYRLRAVTADLPQLGPLGPEPPLFSGLFLVAK
jgi:hypothetical protein